MRTTAAWTTRLANTHRNPEQSRKIKISPLGHVVCYSACLNKLTFLNSLTGGTFCQHLSISFWGVNFSGPGSCNTSMQHLKKKIGEFASLPQPLQPLSQAHSSHIPGLTQTCTGVMLYMRRKQLANFWKCCLLTFFSNMAGFTTNTSFHGSAALSL